jgi:cellulose synthase/poly-beta-1,6-N-acetylglucosamine synthase-like glycosyltransferase
MNYNFSCIILYRHNIQRWNNLKRVLDWLNGFSGVEIIIVEQDTHSKIEHLNFPAKHIFTKSNMPFNRSWGFNVGLKNTNSDIVVFTDCDLIMEPNSFISAIKKIEEYDMVSPYSSVVDLNPEESQLQMESIFRINRPGRGEEDHQKINICGGITIFKKEAILKVGGWNEDFWAWGAEDDYQTIKVNFFLRSYEQKGRCFHLYHDRDAPDQKWYQRNLQILQNAKKMSMEEIQRSINSQISKIGRKNKCDNF